MVAPSWVVVPLEARQIGETDFTPMDMHAAKLGAAMELGKDLAGVEDLRWVKGAFDPLLLIEIILVELNRHEIPLFDANPMFAGQDTADFDAELQDFRTEFLGAFQFARLVGVIHDQRVEIAVAGVEDIGNPKSVFFAHFRHAF